MRVDVFSSPRWTWFARYQIFRTTLLPISNYTPWIKFWNSVRIKVITRNNICTGEVSKFSFSWFYEADPKVVILHDDNPRCGSQSTFQQSTWEHNKTQTHSCPSAARFFYTKFLKVIVSKFLSVPTGKSHIVAKHKECIDHPLVKNPTNNLHATYITQKTEESLLLVWSTNQSYQIAQSRISNWVYPDVSSQVRCWISRNCCSCQSNVSVSCRRLSCEDCEERIQNIVLEDFVC